MWAVLVRLSLVAALAVVTPVAVVAPAFATKTDLASPTEQRLLDEAIGGRCVPAAAKEVLRAYRLQIATAPTLDEARGLVLAQTGLARTALSTAAWMLPFSTSVREARDKIENLERRVYAANTQVEVANEFSDLLGVPAGPDSPTIADATGDAPLMLAEADLNKPAVDIEAGHGGCHYTTGEIIIIVLGFLLLIIPGIIFLVIFC